MFNYNAIAPPIIWSVYQDDVVVPDDQLLLIPAWLSAAIRPDPSPQPSDEKSSCVFRNMEVEASISLEDSLKKEVQCSLQINLEDFEDFSSSLIRTSTPKSQTNFFKPSPVGSPESEILKAES